MSDRQRLLVRANQSDGFSVNNPLHDLSIWTARGYSIGAALGVAAGVYAGSNLIESNYLVYLVLFFAFGIGGSSLGAISGAAAAELLNQRQTKRALLRPASSHAGGQPTNTRLEHDARLR